MRDRGLQIWAAISARWHSLTTLPGLNFVVVMWGLSRLLIIGIMVGVVPHLPIPPGGVPPKLGWNVFVHWDGLFYQWIALFGYPRDLSYYRAFFPLFPLLSRGVISLGLPFAIAGTLVNSLAFLGALVVLHRWMLERYGLPVARWVTAVTAWCPLSLFGFLPYTEGLFLLCSTAALRDFDRHHYRSSMVWGILATATRPTGIALIPALLLVAWKERRSWIAYGSALASAGGMGLFSLYCALKFSDPMAFFHAQKLWRPALGIDWGSWLKLLTAATSGPIDALTGTLERPWHPVLFAVTFAIAGLLLHWRKIVGTTFTGYGLWGVVLVQWWLGGDAWLNLVFIGSGGYLLWHLRRDLKALDWIYGVCALGLILGSGKPYSLARIAYGIVTFSIAIGLLCSRYPRWGYPALAFFGIVLANLALRFAQQQWVG
jgi:Gpi18-like mannosyltransferase